MKTSKMMKIINKVIGGGNITLTQQDVKKLFGGLDEDLIEELKRLGCEVSITDGDYTVRLTRSFDKEEIKTEELLESFSSF